MNRFTKFAFKFLDMIVIFVMTFGSPMSALAQDPAPLLTTDKTEYVTGEMAYVTGVAFAPGDYILTAMGPDGGVANWATVTVAESGNFASASPMLDSAGSYEVRAYASGWAGDWSEAAVATVSFSVTVAPAPTDPPVEPTVEPVLLPYIQSDKPDYAPGELVTLTGGNWQGDTQVRIFVNDDLGQTWSRDVVVDVAADGTIVDSFNLPTWFVATYKVVASGQETGRAVTTAFTDEELGWDQCQNDLDPNDNKQDPCRWTNGALNTNNSIYAEGDVVPQRHIRGVSSAGAHYTIFDHSFYNSSKDAYTYDFWATPDFTLGSDLNPCNELASSLGLTLDQCNTLFAAKQSIPIPTESTYPTGANTYTYPFVAGAEANAAADGVTRNLWISCGTVGGNNQNPTFTTGTCSAIGITILGHGASNGGLLADQDGPPTSDDFVQMKVAYTAPANTFVAIWVGGHLAKASYWNEPAYITTSTFLGYGASTAAGASFHQRLIGWELNRDIGNRDNQIQNSGGTIVPPGSITVIKNDTSDSGTSFGFTASSPLIPATFSLSDDGVNANGENIQAFYNLFTSTYTINELAKDGWDLTGVSCTGGTSSYTYSETGVEINLQPGDNVTCTFANSPMGGLTVTKTANTSLTRTYSWTIDKKADGEYWKFIGDAATAHGYTVSVDKTAADSAWAVSGEIKIKNNAPIAANITGVSDVISDAIPATVNCGVTFPYTLASGNTLTCSYSANLPDAADRTNTATVTTSGTVGGASGTAPVSFTNPTITEAGLTSVSVTDTNGMTFGPVSDDTTFPSYTKSFSCPTNPTAYTDGVYNAPDAVNTATIDGTSISDSATVKLHCYAPVPSKTADASFTRTYSWDITKDYDGTYDLDAGETVTHDYLVTVTKTTTDSGFVVSGDITVTNPNPKAAMTVALADSVGGTVATLDCGGTLTVPAGGSATCGYNATLSSATNGTNTATVTLNSIDFTATKNYTFVSKVEGNNAINVTDTNGEAWGPLSSTSSFPYTKDFTCSTNPANYTNGTYSYSVPNTATITETSQSDDAKVDVTCTLLPLEPSKTAIGEWDRTVTWKLEKSVVEESYSGVPGDEFNPVWTVNLTKVDTGPLNYKITGEIKVSNPANIAQTFEVEDMLDDGTPVTVTCPKDTADPLETVTCTYEAFPEDTTAKLNTVKITFAGNEPKTATAEVKWHENLTGSDSGALTDPRFEYDQNVSSSTSVDFKETFACSTDPSRYTNGTYTETFTNDAYFKNINTNLHDDASVGITCTLPKLTARKDATATYQQDITWTLDKIVSDDSHSGFAGQDAGTSTWTVIATKTIGAPYGWLVTGKIYIHNPATIPQTFSVADVLDDGTNATVTCPDPAVVPAGGDMTCTYTASPTAGNATKNTATITAVGNADITAEAAVSYGSIHVGSETAVLEDGLIEYKETINQTTVETWDQTFSCSSDQSSYTNGVYDYDVTNTATLKYGTETITKNVKVGVDCTLDKLTATKDATATYKQDITWTLDKIVSDASHSGFAGQDAGTSTWTVTATKTIGVPYGWLVIGKIYIHNPATIPQTFSVSDVLDDGTNATVTCPSYTVPADGDVTCTYTASPTAGNATKNTATITAVGNPAITAEAAVSYGSIHVGSETAVLEDGLKGYKEEINQTTILTWDQTFSCSSDQSSYTDGKYNYDVTNTATLKFGIETLTKNVTVGVDCTLDKLTATKDATATYKQDITWTLDKIVSDASHSGFAGQDAGTSTWTVTATKIIGDPYAWLVTGKIYIHNPATIAQTFSVSDVLDDGTNATVTCPEPAVVPAGGDVECSYTASPTSGNATKNTATITFTGNPAVTAEADVDYGSIHVGSETAVLEDGYIGYSETISQTTVVNKDETFSCSSDQSSYTDGKYGYDVTNTATLKYGDETITKNVTVGVDCYAPVVSKTAAGTYDERHEWTVEKTVNPESQSAFAGDTVSYEWTVVVTEQTFEEKFKVAGEITVVNPAPMEMIVDLFDELGGVTDAVIGACTNGTYADGKLTISANKTAVCAYTAEPGGRIDTVNNVTATLNGIAFNASAPFGWTANVIRGSVSLDDDQNPGLPGTISEGGTWNYTEQYTCSTDKTTYDATTHKYTFGESNTAMVKDGETTLDSSTISTSVDCYVPTISKDANGKYDEVHDWEVFKSVNTASQTAFAGEKKNFTWTVRVDETTHGENYVVNGKITVVNPNPEDALTIALSDKLNDGSIATIGPCTGGTWSSPNLTVLAGGTATCDYTVTPKGDLAQFAAALPATVTINSANPGPESYWLTTVSGDAKLNGVYEAWCVDNDTTMNPGASYTATVYSSYEAYPTSLIEKYYNMDLVNWLINQDYVGKPAGGSLGNYTFSDVQVAIWTLVEPDPTRVLNGLGSWNQTRVNQLVAAATANGEGFTPTCGDFVAVLLVPTGGQQPIAIAQVTFASLGIKCADSNVATAVLNGVEFPASAQILWTINKINETASLDDDQKLDWPTTVSADTTFTYQDPQGYTCSTDPAAYTNGYYQYNESNTAVLTYSTGSDTATASTAVKCYAPVVTKTAAGAYDEHHEWEVEKSVTPASQDILAGGTGNFNWTVTVTESITEEKFGVVGTVSIKNPRTDATMVVTLDDVLNDGSTATISGCTVGTWNGTNKTVSIPANSTAVCSYTVAPTGRTAMLNTATVKLNALTTTATANVGWTANVIRGSATLDDDQNPNLPPTITDGGTWTYPDSYTCSVDQGDYNNGYYTHSEHNTATVTSGDKSDSADANTAVTCHAPVVTKDVTTYFNRDWDWTITKDFDATYNLFAGGSTTHGYKITVTPTHTDNFWGVKGNITVTNSHPTEDMVLTSVSDLAGGITGTVTCPILTVPAASSITCTYDTGPQTAPNANPFDDTNTATAVFAAANWTGSADIEFSATPTTEDEPVITVDDDNLTGEEWTADRAEATWTYDKDFACSTNPDDYTDGKDSYSLTNTAKINETGQTNTATVDVNCYAPKVVKDATTYWNRDWDWTIVKDYDGSYNLFAGDTVTHGYKVTVNPTYTDNFWGVKGSITVYNYHPTEAMTLTSLTDLAGGINGNVTCDSLIVPAAGSLTCAYDTGKQTAPNANPFGNLNTATAVFADEDWTGTAPIMFSATPTTEDQPVIHVDDDNLTGESWSATRAAGVWTYNKDFTCPTTLSSYTDGKYTYSLTNTAEITETGQTDTAKVDVNCYAPVVSKTAAGTYDERHEWDVTKTVTPASQNIFASATANFNWTVKVKEVVVEENFVVKGVITVINPSPMPMVANLTDVLGDGTAVTITPTASCAYVNGTLTIPANSTANCDYSATLSYTDDATAAKSNTGEVTLNGLTVPATAPIAWTATIIRPEATLTDVQKPLDELLKSAGPFPGTFDYEFTYPDSYTCSSDVSKYNASGTYKETINNTATVVSGDKTDSSTAATSVNCYIPTVSKTANPTFTRTFLWNITKSVDKTLVKQVGGSAVFNYTVKVNETGYTDSLWKVTGKITIVNPNPSAPITVNVTDAVNNGGVCTVASGTNVTVEAGKSAVFDYTCNFGAGPTLYQGVNTVTAEWTSASTASQLVSNTAAFTFDTVSTGNPTNINKTINVTDTFNGSTTPLGAVTATTSIPYTSKTFTYSRTVAIPTYDCKTYPNTAKIVETNQTASQTIKVCGPINLGGKTIGFWQNKNGQDIIKKAGVTPGTTTCKLTPWLRGFAPFQDLSATATCTQVATYAYNIIKAADSSGASMNAMLKAQMLATALDVYFSDPLLGGNKIGAPAPIGGLTIDLTWVKAGSGYQNVSGGFGGATSMTVTQMLTYAATKSNVGGSMWYANVKATQELAKNAFDAINNSWVFAP